MTDMIYYTGDKPVHRFTFTLLHLLIHILYCLDILTVYVVKTTSVEGLFFGNCVSILLRE